jgi:biotin transport system substrate-specific component
MAPSAGYLLAWPLGAWVCGWVMAGLPVGSPRAAAVSAFAASCMGGLLTVHFFGVLGLTIVAKLTWAQAFVGTLVFVPGDLIKCLVCAAVVQTVARGVPDWQFGGRAIR